MLERLINDPNECGDVGLGCGGGQPILHFMVGVFEFHSSDPVTFGNVLNCLKWDWLSQRVLLEMELSCSPALICAATGFSPTRPQKGLNEQRNSAEFKSCVETLALLSDCRG